MSDNEPTPTSPGGPEVVALADEPGRHARGRPLPRPPEADLTDVAYAPVADAPVPDEDDGYDDDASQRAPAKPQQPRHRSDVSSAVRPRTARDLAEPEPAPAPRPVRRNLEPDPPTRPSPAAHGLAALVGLVAGPVAGAALVLGQSRVLAARTDWDAGVDVPGIALVIMSSLVLAALVLLAVWTAAAPAAGGAATTALGLWALVAPGSFSGVVHVSGSWHTTVEQAVIATTSGTVLVVGLVMLTSALTAAAVRRLGVRLGRAE